MLEELSLVLDKVPFDVDKSVYVSAIVDENVLGKPTRTTRLKTAKRLVELYALDPHCPIFRSFRDYWRGDPAGRPMLAFLTGAARDPLLREMSPFVIGVDVGEGVGSEPIARFLGERYPQRFGPSTAFATAQRLASTWTQAGFLQGKVRKTRVLPRVTPVVLAFAVTLGHLGGLRGGLLLKSPWTDLLDRKPAELQDLAFEASSQGWMNYKAAGEVIEISFPESPASRGEERS